MDTVYLDNAATSFPKPAGMSARNHQPLRLRIGRGRGAGCAQPQGTGEAVFQLQ